MTTTHEDTEGRAWHSVSPRELLRRVIEDNPAADEAVWREQFWIEVQGDKICLQAIVEYWLDKQRPFTRQWPIEVLRRRAERQAEMRVETDVIKEQFKRKIVLLALSMPNGKLLSECTGAECKQFSGWHAKLGELVPADARVGDHLSEEQVNEIWQGESSATP